MTWLELVREYFPDAVDIQCEAILWGYTGYPSFWNIPEDGETPKECCRKQLQAFKDLIQEVREEMPGCKKRL